MATTLTSFQTRYGYETIYSLESFAGRYPE